MKFEIIFSNEFVQSHSPLLMIHFLFYLLSFGIINRRVAKLNGRKQRRRKYAASERVVAVRVKLTVRGKKSSELVVVSLIFASRCHFSSRLLCRTVSSGLANASRTVSPLSLPPRLAQTVSSRPPILNFPPLLFRIELICIVCFLICFLRLWWEREREKCIGFHSFAILEREENETRNNVEEDKKCGGLQEKGNNVKRSEMWGSRILKTR